MSRIAPVDPAAASGKTKQLLDAVRQKLGLTPNLMKTLAVSPAALDAYLAFNAALAGGILDAKLREQIALTVAHSNACGYCLAAHTALGSLVGLSADEITASRDGRDSIPKRHAALQFARTVVAEQGQVSESAVATARSAGLGDAEVIEIVAHVALNILTNYVNHVADTEIDFPRVEVDAVAGQGVR